MAQSRIEKPSGNDSRQAYEQNQRTAEEDTAYETSRQRRYDEASTQREELNTAADETLAEIDEALADSVIAVGGVAVHVFTNAEFAGPVAA
ncbi:MAG TPA: hypothetical protein VLA92_01815 [Candidatus Saccharimonadales bacterium]|nr:hypothetical protein [Candidatus Saccharimonadales bacterium]